MGDVLGSVLGGGAPLVNLITNGTFDTDSDWFKGTGWSIAAGKASFNGSSGNVLIQNNIVEAGKNYRIEFTVLDYVSGAISVRVGSGSTEDFSANADGDYTFDVAETVTDGIAFRSSGVSQFAIDDVAVYEL